MQPRELPILFSTPLMVANLNYRKGMTRRDRGLKKINENPNDWAWCGTMPGDKKSKHMPYHLFVNEKTEESIRIKCPYGNEGDILWGREAWQWQDQYIGSGMYYHRADFEEFADMDRKFWRLRTPRDVIEIEKWKPSIHMPKEAARLWMKNTGVWCERLQNISAEDLIKEGFVKITKDGGRLYKYGIPDRDGLLGGFAPNTGWAWSDFEESHTEAFKKLFVQINGPEGWERNDWVWVVSYDILSTTGKPENI